MEKDCIFCKIANGNIPADIIYEDQEIIAFKDINPIASKHFLIIPKKHYSTLNDLPDEELTIISKIYNVIKQIAKKENIAESGYRTILNTNKESGQIVFHLHFHLIGGRQLKGLG